MQAGNKSLFGFKQTIKGLVCDYSRSIIKFNPGCRPLWILILDCTYYSKIRYISRFFDCLVHPNLDATLDDHKDIFVSLIKV